MAPERRRREEPGRRIAAAVQRICYDLYPNTVFPRNLRNMRFFFIPRYLTGTCKLLHRTVVQLWYTCGTTVVHLWYTCLFPGETRRWKHDMSRISIFWHTRDMLIIFKKKSPVPKIIIVLPGCVRSALYRLRKWNSRNSHSRSSWTQATGDT